MGITRRSAIAGALIASLPALAEMGLVAPVLATGQCRGVGENCNGNKVCCPGSTCTPSGNGNSKFCRATAVCDPTKPCPGGCVCKDGACHPTDPKDETQVCVSSEYNLAAFACVTQFNRRPPQNCSTRPTRAGRRRCRAANRQIRSVYQACIAASYTEAVETCTAA